MKLTLNHFSCEKKLKELCNAEVILRGPGQLAQFPTRPKTNSQNYRLAQFWSTRPNFLPTRPNCLPTR